MRARVNWIAKSEGGRVAPPTGDEYVTVARFPEDGDRWREEAWSVVLRASPPPAEQGNPTFGEVSFLVDEAPQHRLLPGRRFDLFEGGRRVAEVEVLGHR